MSQYLRNRALRQDRPSGNFALRGQSGLSAGQLEEKSDIICQKPESRTLDCAPVPQGGDLRLIVTKGRKNFLRVLAVPRRRETIRNRRT